MILLRDDFIKSVTLYTTRPWYLILAVFPLFCFGVFLCGFSFVLSFGFALEFSLATACIEIWLCLLFIQMLLLYLTISDIHIGLFFTSKKVEAPTEALFVKITFTPNNGGKSELAVLNYPEGRSKDGTARFSISGRTYVWNADQKMFENVEYPISKTFGEYLQSKGFNEEIVYDSNGMNYPPNDLFADIPNMKLLIEDYLSTSKFLFELLCFVTLFYSECVYTSFIALLVFFVCERRFVRRRLRNIMEFKRTKDVQHSMKAYRDKEWCDIRKQDLLPGDLVSVGRSHFPLSCDLLLIRGSCVVEENLPYEIGQLAVTQIKESIETRNADEKFDLQYDGPIHVLYGGSKIIRHSPSQNESDGIKAENGHCLAYILRTGPASRLHKEWRKIRFLPKSGMPIVDILRDFNRGLGENDSKV